MRRTRPTFFLLALLGVAVAWNVLEFAWAQQNSVTVKAADPPQLEAAESDHGAVLPVKSEKPYFAPHMLRPSAQVLGVLLGLFLLFLCFQKAGFAQQYIKFAKKKTEEDLLTQGPTEGDQTKTQSEEELRALQALQALDLRMKEAVQALKEAEQTLFTSEQALVTSEQAGPEQARTAGSTLGVLAAGLTAAAALLPSEMHIFILVALLVIEIIGFEDERRDERQEKEQRFEQQLERLEQITEEAVKVAEQFEKKEDKRKN